MAGGSNPWNLPDGAFGRYVGIDAAAARSHEIDRLRTVHPNGQALSEQPPFGSAVRRLTNGDVHIYNRMMPVPVVLVVLGLFVFALATLLVAARRIDLATTRPFKQARRDPKGRQPKGG
jgi:hypothetical protein